MIEVIVERKEGLICAFSLKGHAETANHGEDLVCAAVSGIVQTSFLGLTEHLKKEVYWKQQSGHFEVCIKSKLTSETEAILMTMLLGLREISKEYPQAISIVEE